MLIFGNERRNDTILFVVHDASAGVMHWYEGIKIFYVLAGAVRISAENISHVLGPEDFLVVNPFEPHSVLVPQESDLIEMRIPLCIVSRVFGASADHHLFDCDSTRCTPEQEPYLITLRRIYADLFRAIYKNRPDHSAYVFSEVYALIDLLSTHFPLRHGTGNPQSRRKNTEQLQGILSYINAHFRSNISIHEVAQANFMTSNYLSRYFQRTLGTTFTDYLSSVRLGSAYSELISSQKTITQIALDNGFRSTNAFIKCFKAQYDETPGKLRRDLENRPLTSPHPVDDAAIFHTLLRHVSRDNPPQVAAPETRAFSVSVSRRGMPLTHEWKNLINIGYAKDGLQATVQEQLRRIQQEIGFRYVRFHGLLDDDMLVYAEDSQGIPQLDFTLVDLLFDFLLSIHLKPYVEFGFVPSLLARPGSRAFRRGSYLCLPTDLDKWMILVEGLVQHLENRYGPSELSTWFFTPMSINCVDVGDPSAIPNIPGYYALYSRVYHLLKHRPIPYQVSGPGVYSNALEESYLWEFLEECNQNHCLPDQFTLLCFPYEPIHDPAYFQVISSLDLPFPEALSADEQYVQHLIDLVPQRLQKAGYTIPSLALVEWNSTMWQRDLCNDSCFKSAWLVKNITENLDRIWGMGYWTVNELLEETASASRDFHGGYGLFTSKGVPKSVYLAFQMLNQLGDHLLYQGEDCTVTRRGNSIQILLYHYCHYDELYRNHYLLDPHAEHCYDRFVEKGDLHITLSLTGLRPGTYRVRRYRLNREYGSAFDHWIAMGLPSYLNAEELDFLCASARTGYHVSQVTVQDTWTLPAQLTPHEVQLILLEPTSTF